MADIGTDHGRLPAFLVASGRAPRAVAVDNKAAPLAVAQALGATFGLGAALEYRLGSGCDGLRDLGTLTVAGMGGTLIASILEGARATGATHLVLQPNSGAAELRAWLGNNGWAIVTELVVADRGRCFVILAAVNGAPEALDTVDLAYGQASKHRNPTALASLLDANEARLRAVLDHHGGLRAEAAIRDQLAVVLEARVRLYSRPCSSS